jgi:hypothetical protein
MQCPSFLRFSLRSSTAEPPDEYKKGYAQFYYERRKIDLWSVGNLDIDASTDDCHPNGWPKLAAFMHSSDSFNIYRKFGFCFARLLITHMSNITEMEAKLNELDKRDAAGGPNTNWRLKNRWHEEGLDTTKRELEGNLEKELLAYGMVDSPFLFARGVTEAH